MKTHFVRAATIAAATFGFAVASHAGPKASVGEPAPDFTLTSSTGEDVSLSDYSGKVVVLEWINHGCPFVKKHYDSGNIPALQKMYSARDVVWLSICSSAEGAQGYYTADKWQKVAKEKDMASTEILIDASGKVGRMYEAKTTPHMYVIDESGTLVYNGAIDSIPSTNTADIARAESYVVAALESVITGEPVAKALTKPYGCNVKYK